MRICTSLLLATAAVATVATPAEAQEVVYEEGSVVYEADMPQAHLPHDGRFEGGWDGQWVDAEHYQGEWDGTYHADAYDRRGDYRDLPASPDGRLAYTMAEREAWLSDCRLLMADGGGYYDDRYYDRRGDNGAVIGGVVGAVAGGVIGNRVADGNRTAGTLIGAGLGGLAGAAVGSALDSDGDGYASRGEVWADRYCQAYLRRYEMGGDSWGFGQQMMVVPVAAHGMSGHSHGPRCTTTVTEEFVAVEEAAPAPRARRVVRRQVREPVREPGKLTPVE